MTAALKNDFATSHLGDGVIQSLILIICLAMLAPQLCRADQATRIQINQAIQPFALPAADSGLLVDIIRSAFASQNLQTRFVFLPAARSWIAFNQNDVDVVTNAKPDANDRAVFSHWPVLAFQNVVISLKKRNLRIESISDLARLRIITFQNASKYLGPEFAEMAAHNKSYFELSTMPSRMLNVDHTDVVISERDIFLYNLLNENKTAPMLDLDEYEYHDVIGNINQYWFGFRSEMLRDQFERGIEAIYRSGEIDIIFNDYQKRFGTSRDLFLPLDCRFLIKNKPRKCSV